MRSRAGVASGAEWALGIAARSRPLLSHGQAAGIRYREATERLAQSRITVHLARAYLLSGNGRAGNAVATKPRAAAHGPRHVKPHRRRGIRRAAQARAARTGENARKRAAAALIRN